jgi:hypothetical protein
MSIAGTIWPSKYSWRLTLLMMSFVAVKMCAVSAARQGADFYLYCCLAEAACRCLLCIQQIRLALTPR